MSKWRVERYIQFPEHKSENLTDWFDLYYGERRVLHLETFWTGFTIFWLVVFALITYFGTA